MKSKTTIVIAIVLIGVVVALLVSSNFSPKEQKQELALSTKEDTKESTKEPSEISYDTFTILMDKMVEGGNWSTEGHKIGEDSTLIVTGLNFTIKKSMATTAPQEPKKETGATETGADTKKYKTLESKNEPVAPPLFLVGNIATVEIKKGLTRKDLEAAFASPNWVNKAGIHLTNGITLKGFGLKYTLNSGSVLAQLKVDDISLKGLSLRAADAATLPGPAGFLKALQVDNFSYNNWALTAEDFGLEYKIAMMEVTDLNFSGTPLLALNTLDPSGLATALSAFSAKNSSTKDVNITLKNTAPGKSGEVIISIAQVEDQDIQRAKIGELKILGAKLEVRNFDMNEDENIQPLVFSVDKFNLTGFDAQDYMNKLVPSLINLSAAVKSKNILKIFDSMSSTMTVADVLFGSYSLDTMGLTGLKLNLGDLLSIELAEADSKLPFKAGILPTASLSTICGLVITLNDDQSKAVGEFGTELYNFGQKFGQTRFEINSEAVTKYDAKTSIFSTKGTKVTVKNLFELHFDTTISGLTTTQLESLSKTPLPAAAMTIALVSPTPIFGDIALEQANVNFINQGLVERTLKFAHAMLSEDVDSAISFEDFKKTLIAGMADNVKAPNTLYLVNGEVLAEALSTFLAQPKSLELNLNPSPLLNAKSLADTIKNRDINTFMNSLNLTIKANGKDAPALKFNVPTPTGDSL